MPQKHVLRKNLDDKARLHKQQNTKTKICEEKRKQDHVRTHDLMPVVSRQIYG
jgi:hypothetical protein